MQHEAWNEDAVIQYARSLGVNLELAISLDAAWELPSKDTIEYWAKACFRVHARKTSRSQLKRFVLRNRFQAYQALKK